PQMEPVRKKLLAEAQRFMQQFLSERGNDPSVRHEAGRVYAYQGDVQDMLGDLDAAQTVYRDAIAIQKELAADAPADLEPQKELARTYNSLGTVLKKADRFQDAESALREALALREQLTARLADLPEAQRDLAASRYYLATVLAVVPGKHEE